MPENSKIEWTDHTFNPWIGCAKVSAGCANCYAESLDSRWSYTPEGWGKGKPRKRTSVVNWRKPRQWNKAAEEAPEGSPRPRVFCASLADWLDEEIPLEWFVDLLVLIKETPALDWLLLTKRPWNFRLRVFQALNSWSGRQVEGFRGWCEDWLDGSFPPQVWIGTSVEDQAAASARIARSLEIPARFHFLSCEPLLEAVSIDPGAFIDFGAGRVDLVIVGGESGPGAREFRADWARSILGQCRDLNSRFFMKQMGGIRKPFPEIPEDLMIREVPDSGGDWITAAQFKKKGFCDA
jgi:protein gp37